MNYEKLRKFRLWDLLDAQINKERHSLARRDSLYPSEASVVVVDPETKEAKVTGGCVRKSWYRVMKFPKSNPPTTKNKYTFKFGDMIEEFIRDLCVKAGIYNNNSVKFWDRSNYVSGEIDIVLEIPADGGIIYTEAKSTWAGHSGSEYNGYNGLFDHYRGRGRNRKLVKAKPKDSNLLQIVIYLYTNKEDPDLIGGKLIYLLRDNFMRTEFDIILVEENGKHRVMVNGDIDERFYVEDIYARYAELAKHVNDSTKEIKAGKDVKELAPPERDYELIFDDQKVLDLFISGDISRTKAEKHMAREEPAGDFLCGYCDFKDLCWSNFQAKWLKTKPSVELPEKKKTTKKKKDDYDDEEGDLAA